MIPSTLGSYPVTRIGDAAFYDCSSLTSVTIPDGVTSIGYSAFCDCRSLTSVTIPDGVTIIGDNTFNGCSGLMSVTIPDSVTSIEFSAFRGCCGLASVTIPDSVTSIGDNAFEYCTGLRSVTIPDSVTSIGDYAFFDCSGLTSVTIPERVTSIGNAAFYGCDSLFDTTMIPGVKIVDGWAVGNIRTLSGDLDLTGIRGIGDYAFIGCSGLTSVTIPDSVTSIGSYAFCDCSGLANVTIPDSVTSIGNAAFYGCSGLASVSIPYSVTSIGVGAFLYCSGLTSVTILDSVTNIGAAAFCGCSGVTSVTIPDSVTSIEEQTFKGCSGLTSVIIPNSVTSIMGWAFEGCSSLMSVTIPDSVTSIGHGAFSDCVGIETIVFEGDLPDVGNGAFDGVSCAVTVNPWKSGWEMSPNATWNGLALKYSTPVIFFDANGGVDVEDAVITDGGIITNNLPVAERPYYEFEGWWTAVSGGERIDETSVIGDTCTLFAHWRSVFNYDVANGEATVTGTRYGTGYSGTLEVQPTVDGYPVVAIGADAFRNYKNLIGVTIPDSVASIGASAFRDSGLVSIEIPYGVRNIETNAFDTCRSLTSVSIPGSVTNIGNIAFWGCANLEEVVISDGVQNIGSQAFQFCSSLEQVTIPESVKSIGALAFYCCTSLNQLTIGNGVERIGDRAFMFCTDLMSVEIPEGVDLLDWGVFFGCSNLVSVSLHEGLEIIGREAFRRCSNLGSVTIPASVTNIQYQAFDSCGALSEVELLGDAPAVGNYAFSGIAANCKATVNPCASGWSLVPDGVWNGMKVVFSSPVLWFDANGGSDVGEIVVTDCGAITNALPSSEKTHYTFSGWWTERNGGSRIDEHSVVSESCTLYAHWTINKYRVVFDANGGGGGTSEELDYNSEIVVPTVTRTGYTFAGWSPDVLERVPAEDVTYTAHWTINKYRVVFNANGGEGGTSCEQDYNSAIVAPTVTRTGYTFAGWDKDVAETVPAEDVAYTAQWTINKYSVVFDSNGGEGGTSGELDYNSEIVTPTVTRIGYTFVGWDKEVAATVPAGDVTYTAQWAINKYNVTFDANGGDGGTSGEQDYNSEIVAPTVTRTGYTFAGWSPDVMERVPAEDVTFTAQWTVNKYRVVFDANGGDGGTNEQIEYATAIAAPIVTRTGYTFLGWDKDVATTVPAEDVNYVAQWKANTYKVSFDANGGEGEWTQRALAYDSAYGELPVPSRKHYEFIGWFTEAEGGVQIAADSVYSTAGDMTLYAHWRCVWEYEENEDGTLTLTAIDPLPEGAVEIPAELEGHAVTALGKGLFNGAEDITQAMIPVTIESLGDWDLRDIEVAGSYEQDGFTIWNGWVLGYDDDTVSYLEVPEGVVGIAPYALSELWDLEEVVLPESLQYIGYRAFYDDGYLGNRGELVIPDGVEVIEDEAFKDCSWLPGIQIGGGVRKIGARAFEGDSSLTTLRLPDAVEDIGGNAFRNCNKLRSVKLPALLETIGADPFAGCNELTGVTVPVWHWTMTEMFPSRYSSIASVSLLGGEGEIVTNAFKGCSSLTSVTIPLEVTNICDGAFMNCSSMTAVELPENLATIGADAFRGCSRLAAIVLPDSVTSIGANVFYGCGSLSNVTLSRSITEIPDCAFYNCGSLTSIVMPEGVTTLGNYISTSLRAVYFLCSKAPECGANVYSSMPSSAKTYVKQGSRGWDGRPSSRVLPESWNGRGIEYWTPVQFDATFDANGGTFELTGETSGACRQTKDTSYALPPFDPVWEGHVFDGWWTERSDGTRITATTRVIEEREITFYAHWIGDPKEVTVRFNANGGTVEPDECSYYSTRPYGTLPVSTREYYRFAGWWTLPQGGTRVVVSTEVPAADQELYAHWSPETYVIRYHANGGNGSMSDQPFVYGRTVTLRRNTFYRTDGQAFIGWAIEPDGAVVYTNEKTLSQIGAIQDGVINLYAVWASLWYAVRFDSNGGYGEMANQTFTIGEAQNITSNAFTRMGFGFIGWTTMPSGDVVYTDGQEVVDLTTRPNATVVLYAVWRLVSPMPEVANDSDVSVVMEDAADSLKANVTSLAEYTAYRAWAENTMESEEAAKTSDKAWLSFALGADKLIEEDIKKEDITIDSFVSSMDEPGEFSFEVSIKNVNISSDADKVRLATVLGIEGAASLNEAAFSSGNVDFEIETLKDGKAILTAKPKGSAKGDSGTFFMRVRVNQ